MPPHLNFDDVRPSPERVMARIASWYAAIRAILLLSGSLDGVSRTYVTF